MTGAAGRGRLSATFSPYVKTHCGTCAAGWTRTGKGGEKLYVCLLDRETVWPEMTDCDRYEAREDSEPPPKD
jgi:hypothetical protein